VDVGSLDLERRNRRFFGSESAGFANKGSHMVVAWFFCEILFILLDLF